MKNTLVALLIRKTQESRSRAEEQVERWRKSIDLVAQVAKQAGCEINLSAALTEPIPAAAEYAKSADHVAAVGLARRAAEARATVLASAQAVLASELARRKAASARAQQEVGRLHSQHTAALERAKSSLDSTTAWAEAHQKPSLPERPEFSMTAASGCGLSCLTVVVGVIISAAASTAVKENPLINILILLGCGGFIIVPVGVYIGHAIRCSGIVSAAHAKAQSELATGRAAFEDKRNLAHAELQAELPRAEESLRYAEAQQQRVEAAMRLLQSQD